MSSKYNKQATLALADSARRTKSSDDFLRDMDKYLEKGADPTWRSDAQTVSALETLLTIGSSCISYPDMGLSKKSRALVDELLERIGGTLRDRVENLSVLRNRSEEKRLVRGPEEKWSVKGPIIVDRPVSLVDRVSMSNLSPELKQERLAWILEHAGDLKKLLSPMRWNVEETQNMRYVPPLVELLSQRDNLPMLESLLETIERRLDKRELRDILNLHVVNKKEGEEKDGVDATALHKAVELAKNALGETIEFIERIVYRLVADGASPDERDADGRTPYALACELSPELSCRLDLFRRDEPQREFELRDKYGCLLLASILDEIYNKFEHRIFFNAESYPRMIENCQERLFAALSMYSEHEGALSQELADEHRLLFSYNAARLALLPEDTASCVEMLVKAGADPRYALPGRLETWREAILIAPYPDEEVTNALLHTPGPDGISLAETLSNDEMNWLRNCECEGVKGLADKILNGRIERDTEQEQCLSR